MSCPGRCQARHSRQVSTTGLIMSNLTLSRPAAWSMCRIFGSFACHHRRCSFLNSFWMTVGSHERRFRKLIWILNLDQSGRRGGPEPVCACWVLSARGCRSRPRVRGASVGALRDAGSGGLSRSPGPPVAVAGASSVDARPGSFCGWSPCTSSNCSASTPLASALGWSRAIGLGSRGCSPVRGGAASSGFTA